MIKAVISNKGSKALGKRIQKYQRTSEQAQRRAIYRGLRAARTIAAKLLRQRFGVPSAVTKKSLSKATFRSGEIAATRLPIPVERLGARALTGKRSRRTVKIRKWFGDSGFGPRRFNPAWEGRGGRFFSTHKSATGRPYRLVARSTARVWVALIPDIQTRARAVYEKEMSRFFDRG